MKLGQDQQFTLILQTLQQLRDKVIYSILNAKLYIKSSMLKLSGIAWIMSEKLSGEAVCNRNPNRRLTVKRKSGATRRR